MKTLKTIISIALLGVLITPINVTAQSIDFNKNECFSLITDRPYYFVNQLVQFTAINCSDEELKNPIWSKVLYIELITPAGIPVYQGKYSTQNDGANGKFIVPQGIPTGVYYLRAYTKWMRNFSTTQFAYQPISIINPSSNEILENTSISLDSAIVHNTKKSASINIETQYKSLDTRSQGRFTIMANSELNILSIVIRPKEHTTISDSNYIYQESIASRKKFIPETRGISLTGKVINSIDSTPLSYQVVNLTLFHEKKENIGSITNENGIFFFTLPNLNGASEVFISVQNTKETIKPIIQVDNDFCTRPVNLPNLNLAIPHDILSEIKNKFKILQVEQEYFGNTNYTNNKLNSSQPITSFFGKPTISVVFEEFIELPTIEDYISEVVPSTYINYLKKKPILKIAGLYPEMKIYEPLILVDMVKLPNIDPVLKISPHKIKQIDVVPKPYIIGNYTYGGIISFVTKNNDLAGIDLPESGKFFSFNLFENKVKNPISQIPDTKLPDCRTVLYWNPCFSIHKGESKNITFYTSDIKGAYEIVITGKDANNRAIEARQTFWVN